uniref:Uncharacterized protein n=1 Tax=Anguilla anguilla TaxID=7936 RepID=A0A0E9Q6C1_ANGAN
MQSLRLKSLLRYLRLFFEYSSLCSPFTQSGVRTAKQ